MENPQQILAAPSRIGEDLLEVLILHVELAGERPSAPGSRITHGNAGGMEVLEAAPRCLAGRALPAVATFYWST
jgi:hypothetical protein